MPPEVWIPAAVSLLVAVLAASATVANSNRTNRAQRDLEQLKIRANEQAVELASQRAEVTRQRDRATEYRREQVLPFMSALHDVLNSSYSVAYLPPNFPELGGRIPQIRRYADRALVDWMRANESLSKHRMRLFLSIDIASVDALVEQLLLLQSGMERLLDVRNRRWLGQSADRELWAVHREYVTAGTQIMMIVSSHLMRPTEPILHEKSREDREALAKRLAPPFERLSTARLPYGKSIDFMWLAIWDISTDDEWNGFVEQMGQGNYAEFEEQWRELSVAVRGQENVIESTPLAVSHVRDRRVLVLTARLAGLEDLDLFISESLRALRKAYPLVWSSLRQPTEIEIRPDSWGPVKGNETGAGATAA